MGINSGATPTPSAEILQILQAQQALTSSGGIDPSLLSLLGLGLGPSGTIGGLPTTAQRGGGAFPFSSQYASNVTLQFGQIGPFGAREVGNDYGMPVGTPIYTPFGGWISTESHGKNDWGNRIFVRDPGTGLTFAVGHLNRFATTGGYVPAGTLIGYSGGDPSDPNSGSSDGPHVEVQLIDPSGHYIDPHPWMQQLLQTNDPGLPPGTQTPDGHYLLQGTQDETFYNLASLAWEKAYGTLPPWSAIEAMRASGVSTLDQVQQVLWGMPSQFAGVSMGQAETMRDAANKVAQKLWGRPVPDSFLQELLNKGVATTADIQLAIESTPASKIPKDQYQAIYDAALPYANGIWGSQPDPNQIAHIHEEASKNEPGGVAQPAARGRPVAT